MLEFPFWTSFEGVLGILADAVGAMSEIACLALQDCEFVFASLVSVKLNVRQWAIVACILFPHVDGGGHARHAVVDCGLAIDTGPPGGARAGVARARGKDVVADSVVLTGIAGTPVGVRAGCLRVRGLCSGVAGAADARVVVAGVYYVHASGSGAAVGSDCAAVCLYIGRRSGVGRLALTVFVSRREHANDTRHVERVT